MRTNLSVNINKVATLRNARGEDRPDVVDFALKAERFGADGITVHPRPDERHIRRSDVPALKAAISTEFNIEGYPSEDFLKLVEETRPAQVTLVPDAPGDITSSAGWDVTGNFDFLSEVVKRMKKSGIRVSIFVDPDPAQIRAAAKAGADRVELYTKPYADRYAPDPHGAVAPFAAASIVAHEAGLEVNAGHDLSLENIAWFHDNVPYLNEVSIGHAIICECLDFGLEETLRHYLEILHN